MGQISFSDSSSAESSCNLKGLENRSEESSSENLYAPRPVTLPFDEVALSGGIFFITLSLFVSSSHSLRVNKFFAYLLTAK